MKLIKSFLVLAFVSLPAIASAQPAYYVPRAEGGFHARAGHLAWGVSAGIGGMTMNGNDIQCPSCDYNPLAGEVDFHIGGMVNHRMAVLFELQVNGQTVEADAFGSQTLEQAAFMGAIQYWLTPIVWIKGGLGVTRLIVDDSDYGQVSPASSGVSLLGSAGVELLSGRRFALDLQGRLITAQYHGDMSGYGDRLTSLTVGVGLNWY